MKTKSVYKMLDRFVKKLGDENITASIAVCEGEYYVTVSCHSSSKFEFKHGGHQRTAKIHPDDLERGFHDVLGDLINRYIECLQLRKGEPEEIRDVIERTKALSN